MLPSPDSIAAREHWRRSPAHVAQRFYVAFCLFMSSVQDAFLGLMDRERNNRNWAATCAYYALVHGGRLLTFLALGDFPRRHKTLQAILSGASNPLGSKSLM